MSASIHQIAEAAECSIATVSRVFNQRPNVRVNVRQRVLEAARQLGYNPKLTARRDTIAVVTENFDTEPMGAYETMLTAQLVRTLSREGRRVEIIPTAELEVFQDKFFQGVISLLYQTNHINELAALCRRCHLPLVCVNHELPDSPSVSSDDRQGIKAAITLLVERGHRDIALVLKAIPTTSQLNRRKFFAEALAERGLGPGHILQIPDVERVTEEMLKLLRHPVSAVIVAHEDYGIAVSYALTLAGRRVPEELSLITYESSGVSRFCTPAQTTIAQDFSRIADEAVRLLKAGNNGSSHVLLPYSMIERDSVAIARNVP